MLLCLGLNTFGQLGGGQIDDVAVVLATPSDEKVIRPLAGASLSGIVTTERTICWGSALYGESPASLGNGSYVALAAASAQLQLSDHVCASSSDTTVNLAGRLSGEHSFTERVLQIAIGRHGVLILTQTGLANDRKK